MIPVVVHTALLPEEQRDPKVAEEHAKALERPLPVLDAHLSGCDYVLGADAFSIADLNPSGSAIFASLAGFDLSLWPEVKRWLAACEARPALERARSK